jgi:hypothetical protein
METEQMMEHLLAKSTPEWTPRKKEWIPNAKTMKEMINEMKDKIKEDMNAIRKADRDGRNYCLTTFISSVSCCRCNIEHSQIQCSLFHTLANMYSTTVMVVKIV